jgi:hypothetical protein
MIFSKTETNKQRVFRERKGLIFLIKIVLVVAILPLIFKAGLINALFWVFFLACLLFRLDGRISLVLGLASLVICPFLLIFKKEADAEVIAVYAYYFLVIGTILSLIEYVREERKKKQKKNE